MTLTTVDTNNYDEMAKAMGISAEASSKSKQSSNLARLRIAHTAIMGETELKGKKVNMEVVSGGHFKLEIPDGRTIYSPQIKIRTFLQRFMYKRFIKGSGNLPNRFVKTIMGDSLYVDLKDNDGGFNCGKPSGWIKDFKALPTTQQDLIRQIKRTRVVFGLVDLVNPIDSSGAETKADSTAFIWEIDNRDAFKILGDTYNNFNKQRLLPIAHEITVGTEEKPLPNGSSFYIPEVSADMTNAIPISSGDQTTFTDFMEWVDSYNEYIATAWNDKSKRNMSSDDASLVDEFLDIDDAAVA
tara:strand:+ start:4476 stop:5369 length:894 start_codon:yes stop_codon:yes gene_type:complete